MYYEIESLSVDLTSPKVNRDERADLVITEKITD